MKKQERKKKRRSRKKTMMMTAMPITTVRTLTANDSEQMQLPGAPTPMVSSLSRGSLTREEQDIWIGKQGLL